MDLSEQIFRFGTNSQTMTKLNENLATARRVFFFYQFGRIRRSEIREEEEEED